MNYTLQTEMPDVVWKFLTHKREKNAGTTNKIRRIGNPELYRQNIRIIRVRVRQFSKIHRSMQFNFTIV